MIISFDGNKPANINEKINDMLIKSDFKKDKNILRFGKYKGEKINKIIKQDKNYCLWLYDLYNNSEDKHTKYIMYKIKKHCKIK